MLRFEIWVLRASVFVFECFVFETTRWGRLLFLDFLDLRLAVHFIIATCVPHNFCILHDDFYDGYLMDDDSDDHYDDVDHCPGGTAEQKQTHLMNIVCA